MNLTFRFYTQRGCAPCLRVKPALVEFLERNNVQYEEVDIFNELEFSKSLGILATPAGVLYTGDIRQAENRLVYGALDEEKLAVIKGDIDAIRNTQPVNNNQSKIILGTIVVTALLTLVFTRSRNSIN